MSSSGSTVTSKLKVHRSNVNNNDNGICRGQDLQRILKAAMPDCLVNSGSGKKENHLVPVEVRNMEVYDTHTNAYLSLNDPDVVHADLTQRFGTRLQIHVTVNQQHTNNGQPRAIAGRYYSYDAEKGLMIANVSLQVQQVENQTVGTGMNVWDGAVLLANYLEKNPKMVQSKNVMELGAGCGLVGLAAGVLGAQRVLMTDLPYALPNMQANVARHAEAWKNAGCQQVVCAPLDWYHPPSLQSLGNVMDINTPWIPDLILVADCVWMQQLVEPLLSTLQHLTEQAIIAQGSLQQNKHHDSAGDDAAVIATRVLLSYQRRGKSTHEEFWNGLHSDRFPNAKITQIDVTASGLVKPDSIYLLLMEFRQ